MSRQTYFGDGNGGPFWFPARNTDDVIETLDGLDPSALIYWLMPSPSPDTVAPAHMWDPTLHPHQEFPNDA